jgi:hypothetical protein
MNLDTFIENKFPKFRQYFNTDHNFSIDYFFNQEPNSSFTKIPKTIDISIHSSIEDYISKIKTYSPPNYYVANTKDIEVIAMNDVGSVNVVGNNNIVFSDVSTRYEFDNFSYKRDYYFTGNNVLLSLDSGSNYFHWVCQILPRIKLLEESGLKWSKVNKILIPEIRGRFVKESLRTLNVPMDKLVEQKSGCKYKFENLYIPSKPNNHIHLSKWSIDFLRETFIQKSNQSKLPKKIFISRKEKSGRHINNEKPVEKVLKNFGFQKFILDDMSIFDQAILFNNASHIITSHGASLANLVFCNQNTKVFELFNPNYFHALYWSICNNLDLDYYYMICESPDSQNHKNASLKINLNDLKNILNHANQ